jgi:hypothetical protein
MNVIGVMVRMYSTLARPFMRVSCRLIFFILTAVADAAIEAVSAFCAVRPVPISILLDVLQVGMSAAP